MFRAKTTFFFLLLLGCQSFGWQLWWHWKQAAVRQQHYRATTYEGNLEHPTMALSYFEQCRIDDHELRIQGEMYDIAAQETKGDSVYVVLYHDFEEGHLFKALAAFLKNNPDSTYPFRSPAAQLTRYLGQFFLTPSMPVLVLGETELRKKRLHISNVHQAIRTVSGPEPPPPRI